MEFVSEETVVSSPFRVELPAANSPSELDPHGHHDWPAKRRPSRLTFGCGNFLQPDIYGAHRLCEGELFAHCGVRFPKSVLNSEPNDLGVTRRRVFCGGRVHAFVRRLLLESSERMHSACRDEDIDANRAHDGCVLENDVSIPRVPRNETGLLLCRFAKL